MKSRRDILRAGAGVALTAPALVAGTGRVHARAEATGPVVVELFTSQGCSSCPPADRFAGDLAKRDDCLPLTLSVDYWDYLGWKDTLASPDNTKRQTNYNHALMNGRLYTPQMVIQGYTHEVGSRRHKVAEKIRKAKFEAAPRIPIDARLDGGQLTVSVPKVEAQRQCVVWAMPYTSREEIEILRGENRGETVAYHNVVRHTASLGTWTGEPLTAQMTLKGEGPRIDGIAILVQRSGFGRIDGSLDLKLPAPVSL